jgi:hypothetical protein
MSSYGEYNDGEDDDFSEDDFLEYTPSEEELSDYASTVPVDGPKGAKKTHDEFLDQIASQSLREASTQDLVTEMQSRFQDFAILGKRYLEVPPSDGERDTKRRKMRKVDTRMVFKGDVHTLAGMLVNASKHMDWNMEEGSLDLEYGTRDQWELERYVLGDEEEG